MRASWLACMRASTGINKTTNIHLDHVPIGTVCSHNPSELHNVIVIIAYMLSIVKDFWSTLGTSKKMWTSNLVRAPTNAIHKHTNYGIFGKQIDLIEA
jgi:hypothetical protein